MLAITTTGAILLTGGFTLAASGLAGYVSLRALGRQQKEERRREERAHLRSILENSAAAMYTAFVSVSASGDGPLSDEEVTVAARTLRSARGRLLLYFAEDTEVSQAWEQATAAIYGLSALRRASGETEEDVTQLSLTRTAYVKAADRFLLAARTALVLPA